MTSSEILQSDVLDIVFDNRNKAYGAYALRRSYEKRMWMSVGITAGLSALLFLLYAREQMPRTTPVVAPGPVTLTTLELPVPIEKPVTPAASQAPQKRAATEHFTGNIRIVEDSQVPPDEVLPPVEALAEAAFGTEKVDGVAAAGHVAHEAPAPAAPEQAPPAPEPLLIDAAAAEEQALFPGGTEAFARYLSRQIGQPEGLAPGESRKAKVRLVVAKDGMVLAVEVLQSATAELDKVVIRALQRSPRWKPARQQGKEVAVLFTLPVTFVGTEE